MMPTIFPCTNSNWSEQFSFFRYFLIKNMHRPMEIQDFLCEYQKSISFLCFRCFSMKNWWKTCVDRSEKKMWARIKYFTYYWFCLKRFLYSHRNPRSFCQNLRFSHESIPIILWNTTCGSSPFRYSVTLIRNTWLWPWRLYFKWVLSWPTHVCMLLMRLKR